MPKEDRSGWVAVAPDASASTGSGKIKPAKSAFRYFEQSIKDQVNVELKARHGKFQVGDFTKAVRERWNNLSSEDRVVFEDMARQDQSRFAQESHAADVAALERKARLQKERDMIMLDDEAGPQRTTRKQLKKTSRKRERKEKRKGKRIKVLDANDDEEFREEDDEDASSDSFSEGSEDESSDSDESSAKRKKKKKAAKPKRVQSQKQIEYREKIKRDKKEKDDYIASRQEDLKQEKAMQAQKRLDFLLKQSNIFSHFGAVKQDQQKFGGKTSEVSKKSRRDAAVDSVDKEDEELKEAEEQQTTFLTSQPTTIGFGKMRNYQLEGLNWMIRLQENGVNGILADEMGLGKTLQTISVLVYMLEYQNNTGPHLIVVPKSTLSNWMLEIGRWAPTLKPVKFHGDKATREHLANNVICPGQKDEERSWHVCITTYEICNIERNVLNKFAWTYLIIDEAHRLKNEASAFSQTVRAFETRYRILITGTPLQNSLHELWALLNFLVPDVFASADQFDEWFNLDIDDNDEKNKLISQLHKILRPFMLRRLKKEVEKSLPPKHETILFCGMSAMQKKLYRDILIRDIDAVQGTSGSRTAILNIVMQLRKCAGHPYLFPGVEDRTLPPLGEHIVENCGKMVLLDKLLKRLKEKGHRVLLFTQMTRILDILEDYLIMRRYQYCRIDGNTTYEMREDYIEAYNKPNSEKFLFLLSTRAGGLGINLQTADVVILFDSDWNPQADLQAQDRAHRIGQKRPVQVFRFVTEHTVEEKIVERAQQKLKLDAMVVQQGRLKDQDKKLSRDDLLQAVRFGADKIFKSKDSSITDDDINMILDAGKRKTQELNDKLQAADKGDLLDFKLDGNSNLQTFEGIDYSNGALAAARAEAELLGILDVGKRERRTVANYNENQLYQQQVAANQVIKKKKKKIIKLPKELRLPRMEEWQMYDRNRLMEIQEQEEINFRALPEELQKWASQNKNEQETAATAAANQTEDSKPAAVEANGEQSKDDPHNDATTVEKAQNGISLSGPTEMPPLLEPSVLEEKKRLLAEGFDSWNRSHYSAFIKANTLFGRSNVSKIANYIGKPESEVERFVSSYWGDVGKARISDHEYDRVLKLAERGERKIDEIKSLERSVRILVSLFDNPWEELEFSHVVTKDKLFSADNDRYLICWSHKYGYGQWGAIKMAIRRSPKFRFDYFLRSLPVDQLGRRCEHLMRAAVKEVEHLEKKEREAQGLPTEAEDGSELPPVTLKPFKIMEKQRSVERIQRRRTDKKALEEKVDDIERQMKEIHDRLKQLNKDPSLEGIKAAPAPTVAPAPASEPEPVKMEVEVKVEEPSFDETKGDLGPDGEFVEFPEYDGKTEPKESKKPFTQFCVRTRKAIKDSLPVAERKNKKRINNILKEQWLNLPEDEKSVFRQWAAWDKKRFGREMDIYENGNQGQGASSEHTRFKREISTESVGSPTSVPKKKKRV